jgi:hypothetical protein
MRYGSKSGNRTPSAGGTLPGRSRFHFGDPPVTVLSDAAPLLGRR